METNNTMRDWLEEKGLIITVCEGAVTICDGDCEHCDEED